MQYDKQYLSDIRFIGFLYRKAYAVSRIFWVHLLVNAVSRSLTMLLWVYFPKLILDELTGGKRMHIMLTMLAGFVLLQFLCGILTHVSETKLNLCSEKIDHHLRKDLAEKIMKLDYAKLEDPKTLDLKDRASEGIQFWGGIAGINELMTEILAALLSISTLLVLVVELNVFFAAVLFVFVACKTVLSNKLRVVVMHFWDKLGIFNRQFRYLSSLMTDYRYGKDIRLYHMADLVCEKSEEYKDGARQYYVKQGNQERRFYFAQNSVGFLQDLVIYGFIVLCAFHGELSIGDLVFYISAATNIVLHSTDIAGRIVEMKRICQYGQPYKEFMQLEEADRRGNLPVPVCDAYTFKLQNISFRYPGSENDVLKDITLSIRPGEKISIVGLNGAGKTTLIKLLLRLYEPTEGTILLNGVDIRLYDYADYLKLFAVVFQDFRLLATSIRENIACTDETILQEQVWNALSMVGLDEKCGSLPKKENTQLLKHFYEDGIELSGGENQKLAIARAIYKDAPFVFLDEPTANLDPIAEYEIFSHFDRLVSHKTTVYISHRLSTCRFSDRVVVIDKGRIAENGTHEELIHRDGLYRDMWNAQAQYYV